MGRRYYIDPDTGEEVYIRDKVPSLAQYRKAADQDEIDEEIRQDLANYLPAPANPQVGKILKILSVNADGTFTCGWADDSDTHPVADVQINGTSILNAGIATIPLANAYNKYGLFKIGTNKGFALSSQDASMYIHAASDDNITDRTNEYRPIVPKNLDYAVKKGLADSKIDWSDTDKLAARQRIGAVGGKFEKLCNDIEYNNDFSTESIDIPTCETVIVMVSVPAYSETFQINVTAAKGGNPFGITGIISNGVSTSAKTGVVRFDVLGCISKVETRVSSSSYNATNSSQHTYIESLVTEINKIKINAPQNKVIPAGAVVKLYGVKV